MVAPVQHRTPATAPGAAHTPDPIRVAMTYYTELVVGELITTRGTRFVCISVHPALPLAPRSLVVVIFNIHPDRSFSSLCSSSWKTAGEVVAGFLNMLNVHCVRFLSMEDDQSSFTAVISTDKDAEIDLLGCF
jgi:hypothetical protein